MAAPAPEKDLYVLLRDNANKDPVLEKLWTQVNMVPELVDWEEVRRGQEFFHRYAAPVITGFAFQGLLSLTVSPPRL